MERDKLDEKRIFLFLAITFLITYVIEIVFIAPMAGSGDASRAMMAQSLIAAVMFVPAVSVALTRLLTKEGFAIKELHLAFKWKGNQKYYMLVWPGLAGMILLGAILYFLIFRKQFDSNLGYIGALLTAQDGNTYTTGQLWQYMFFQLLIGVVLSPLVNLVNCFGEEWGWRGYLLPKLLKCMPVVPAVLLDGAIWGLWHAPLIALTGYNYGIGYAGYPVTGILAMCVFCMAVGTIFSYTEIKTGSCIPSILGHGMINGFSMIGVYFTSLEYPYNVFFGPMPLGLIGGLFILIMAGVLLYQLDQEEKAAKSAKEQVKDL